MSRKPPDTIVSRFLTVVGATPDRTAVFSHGRAISYSDLADRLHRTIAWFDRQGISPGLSVAVIVRDELNHLLTALALLRLGCRQIPIAVSETPARRKELIGRCGVSVIVAEDARHALPNVGLLLPPFEDIQADPALVPGPLPPEDPGAPQMYVTSSGTTGRSKLAGLSQAQLLTYSSHRYVVPGAQVVFRASHIEYDTIRRQHMKALTLGATTVLCDTDAYAHPGETCFRYGVRTLVLAPAVLRSLIEAPPARDGRRLPQDTKVVVGGSEVTASVRQDALRHLSDDVRITYGTTECGSIAEHRCRTDDPDASRVGRVWPNVEVRIEDEEGRHLPAGEIGRIGARSPGMVSGYLDDPDATARNFRNGWFFSGDLGAFDRDGVLHYHGRSDDMMILNNLNIHPSEIERFVDTQPGVVESAAFALRSPVYGDIPVVAIVVGEGFDRSALMRAGRDTLGMRAPRRIFEVENLPRNAMGKILRRELESQVRETMERTTMERQTHVG